MTDRREREMLEEVALRNAIAKFRAMSKRAAIPEVGIFWIDDAGMMFAESVSLRDASNYGDFRIFEGSHYEVWPKAVRTNPKWCDLEYEEIPRGRVVYKRHPKPVFIVYLPNRILKHKGKIREKFNLPARRTFFDTSDEHYRM